MNCRTVQSKLGCFLDGELSVRDQRRVERHLGGCASCREELERLRLVGRAIEELPEPPDVPAGFAERVMARAVKRLAEDRPTLPFWQSISPAMRIAAAAMVVLGICLGVMMSRDLLRGTGSTPEVAVKDLGTLYGFDYLTDAPKGSLADSYVALAAGMNGGGE